MKYSELYQLRNECATYSSTRSYRLLETLKSEIVNREHSTIVKNLTSKEYSYNIGMNCEKIDYYNIKKLDHNEIELNWNKDLLIGRGINKSELRIFTKDDVNIGNIRKSKPFEEFEGNDSNEYNEVVSYEIDISRPNSVKKALNYAAKSIVWYGDLNNPKPTYNVKFVSNKEFIESEKRIENYKKTLEIIIENEKLNSAEDISQLLSENLNSDKYTYSDMDAYYHYSKEIVEEELNREIYLKMESYMRKYKLHIRIMNYYNECVNFIPKKEEPNFDNSKYKSKKELLKDINLKLSSTPAQNEKLLNLIEYVKDWEILMPKKVEIFIKNKDLLEFNEDSDYNPFSVFRSVNKELVTLLETSKMTNINLQDYEKILVGKYELHANFCSIEVTDLSNSEIRTYESIKEFWKKLSSEEPYTTINELNKNKPIFPYDKNKDVKNYETLEQRTKYYSSLTLWRIMKDLAFKKMNHKNFIIRNIK